MGASIDFKNWWEKVRPLQKTLKAIEQVAPTFDRADHRETGTEKNWSGHHLVSPRKAKPLIRVNCAALPPTLIEVGVVRSTRRTSAAPHQERSAGLNWHGGTIFLDEIGEIPLDLQAKLLRVHQEAAQELERVGGTHTVRVDTPRPRRHQRESRTGGEGRAIQARSLLSAECIPAPLPPARIREQREDIPLLAETASCKRYGILHRKAITRIPASTLKALSAYDWPGNVRELQHVIERAVIVSRAHR
ncbi:MAG: sigma 54-interacting transcriptional regulator [Nitrospira sp.]